MRRLGMRMCGRVGLLAAVMALISASSAFAATDYTWTGGGTNTYWTNGANWAGGVGPTGSVGTLIFPELTSPACTASPPTTSCYVATGLVSNLAANALTIDDNQPYDLGTGYNIELGAGGLTATPDASNTVPAEPTTFQQGFELTAPQTWSIDGGSQQQDGLVIDNGQVSGNEPLTVDFSNDAYLEMYGTLTSVAANGPGDLIPADNGGGANLNAPITLANGAGIFAPATSRIEDVSDTGGFIETGIGVAPDATLSVMGALDLEAGSGLGFMIDQTGTTPGDYSSDSVTGNVTLNGAQLELAQGSNQNDVCVDLNPGDIDTLLKTTSGTITGTFAGIPDGATVKLDNDCDISTQAATATINYTSTTVTATILSGGNAGDAPQNTAAPTISGSAIAGATLTASPGTWSGSPTYAYQWYACTSACSPISGATAASYVPTTAQQGETISVEVTGTNASGSSSAYSNATAAIKPPAPTNVAAPQITGTTTQGDTLTASTGTWTGSPTSYEYYWDRCNANGTGCLGIPGATSATYVLGSQDVQQTLTVTVTAVNSTGKSAAIVSATTAVIQPPPVAPQLVKAPVVSGNPVVGQALTASTAQFSGSPLTYADAWERCKTTSLASCTAIPGATSSRLVVASGDVGEHLIYVAGAVDGAGHAAGISAFTTVVQSASQIKTAIAKLGGPSGTAATIAKVLAKDGYSVRYAAPSTGTFSVSWTAKSHGKTITVARFSKVLSVRGTLTVAIKLTPAGKTLLKSLLKSRSKAAVTATVEAKLPGAPAITAKRVLELKG